MTQGLSNRAKARSGLCQNCVTYPSKPLANTVIYGHTPMPLLLREVVNGNCVGGIWCSSARASGFNFQACSFNHSVRIPLRQFSATPSKFPTLLHVAARG